MTIADVSEFVVKKISARDQTEFVRQVPTSAISSACAALNPPDRDTFYVGGEKGYIMRFSAVIASRQNGQPEHPNAAFATAGNLRLHDSQA